MDPRHIVTDEVFQVEPDLLGADLAAPWRRGVALLLDLLIAGTISALGGATIAATLAAAITYRVMTRARPKGLRGFFRRAAASGGAVVVLVFVLGILRTDSERTSVRIVASNAAGSGSGSASGGSATSPERSAGTVTSTQPAPDDRRAAIETAVRSVLEVVASPKADADPAALDAAVGGIADSVAALQPSADLVAEVARLNRENERLREAAESPSLLRSVRGVASDFGLTFGWVGAYFTLLMAWWNGRTPGKRLLGLRVYRLDGRPFTLWSAFERFGGYAAGLATGLLGFAQIYWDRNRQGIHDRIAGTVVVHMVDADTPRRTAAGAAAADP